MTADQWIERGEELFELSKYSEAEAAFAKATALAPSNSLAWGKLGNAMSWQERHSDAEIAYKECVRFDNQNKKAWYNLGRSLGDQEKWIDGEGAYRQAIHIDPKFSQAWHGLGISQYSVGKYAEAEESFVEAIRLDPQIGSVWHCLGRSRNMLRSFAEAEQAFLEATRLEPHESEYWSQLGRVRVIQGKHVEAAEPFLQATRLDPINVEAWRELGLVEGENENLFEAEHAFLEATRLAPEDSRTWTSLGLALRQQDKHAEAENAYLKVIDIVPENASARNDLGDVLRVQGKVLEAEKSYLEGIRLDPQNAKAWYSLGVVQSDLDKDAEAEDAFLQATRLDPQDFLAWRFLGVTRDEQQKYVEAERAMLEATRLAPQDLGNWMILGASRYHQERYAEAEQAFREAIHLAPLAAEPWSYLCAILLEQGKHVEAERAGRQLIKLRIPQSYIFNKPAQSYIYDAWSTIAESAANQGKGPAQVLYAYKRMARAIEASRGDQSDWKSRVEEFRNPILDLQDAADFALGAVPPYAEDALNFAVQSKGRFLGDLLRYNPVQLQELLSTGEREKLEALEKATASLAMDQDGLDRIPQTSDYATDSTANRAWIARSSIQEQDRREKRLDLAKQRESLFHQVVIEHPELEPFVLGPTPQSFRFSLDKLKRRLQVGEAVLELVLVRGGSFLGFLVTRDGLVRSLRFPMSEPLYGKDSPTGQEMFVEFLSTLDIRRRDKPDKSNEILADVVGREVRIWMESLTEEQWANYISKCLPDTELDLYGPELIRGGPVFKKMLEHYGPKRRIDQAERADTIKEKLTEDVLVRWGQLLYGGFIDDLAGVHRLWVSPHAFLTQLPFNAIPFPDGVEREVAVIPSAASLLQPKRRGPKPKPRFTLGVVAADAVDMSPLDLQSEEVRRLRGTVRSARRRWELAGARPGEQPTLAKLQERAGLTRCLVLSCHGDGPNEDWGILHLGARNSPEQVTGRALVDSFLLASRFRGMEVDMVVTSACLTGQVNIEDAEEWLGLPMALQAVWKTRVMLLTLWEVGELPAMIWVVELVRGLATGLTAGEAHRKAQAKVRTVTREEVEGDWLSEAHRRLPTERWERVDVYWRETSRTGGQRPFADPVHWAPFVLVGDPRVTISPRR